MTAAFIVAPRPASVNQRPLFSRVCANWSCAMGTPFSAAFRNARNSSGGRYPLARPLTSAADAAVPAACAVVPVIGATGESAAAPARRESVLVSGIKQMLSLHP